MAKLIREFDGVPAGEIYPVTFKAGDECPPELEAAARAVGAIGPAAAPAPAPAKPAAKPAAKE